VIQNRVSFPTHSITVGEWVGNPNIEYGNSLGPVALEKAALMLEKGPWSNVRGKPSTRARINISKIEYSELARDMIAMHRTAPRRSTLDARHNRVQP